MALVLGFIGLYKLPAQDSSQQLLNRQALIVTASQYAEFLNYVAVCDPDRLYDDAMGSTPETACIVRLGTPGKYSYQVIAGRENFPICYVNNFDEENYCNKTGDAISDDNENNDLSLKCNLRAFEVDSASVPISYLLFDSQLLSCSPSRAVASQQSVSPLAKQLNPISQSTSTGNFNSYLEEASAVTGLVVLAAFGHELMLRRASMTGERPAAIQEESYTSSRAVARRCSSDNRIQTAEKNSNGSVKKCPRPDYFSIHAAEHSGIADRISPKLVSLTDDHPWMIAYHHASSVVSNYRDASSCLDPAKIELKQHPLFGTAASQRDISDYLIRAAKCYDKATEARKTGREEAADAFMNAFSDYTQAAKKRKPKSKKESDLLTNQAKQKEATAASLLSRYPLRHFSTILITNENQDSSTLQLLSLEERKSEATCKSSDNETKENKDKQNTPFFIRDEYKKEAADATPQKRPSADSKTITPKKSSLESNASSEPKDDRLIANLKKTAQDVRTAAKYGKDMHQAVNNIVSILDAENCKEAFDRMDDLINQCVTIDIAAASATIAAKNIEKYLVQLESITEKNFSCEESSHDDHLLFVAADLALTAIKKAADKIRSVSTSIMSEPKYQGVIADEALATFHVVDAAHFNPLFEAKQSILLDKLSFSTLIAKKEALNRAAHKAQAAFKYATDTLCALNNIFEVCFFSSDYDTDQKLTKFSENLKSAESIANAAAENIKERLAQLEGVPNDESSAKESPQEDAKLFIAVDLAVNAVKEAAEEVRTVAGDITRNNEYDCGEWIEIKRQSLADLEEACTTFNSAIQLEAASIIKDTKLDAHAIGDKDSINLNEAPVLISNQFLAPISERSDHGNDRLIYLQQPSEFEESDLIIRTESPTPGNERLRSENETGPVLLFNSEKKPSTENL